MPMLKLFNSDPTQYAANPAQNDAISEFIERAILLSLFQTCAAGLEWERRIGW